MDVWLGIFLYLLFGIVAHFIVRAAENWEKELFRYNGYFGKYLERVRGHYGSIVEIRGELGWKKENYSIARKRYAVYILKWIFIDIPVGLCLLVSFPVHIILGALLND